MTCKYYNPDADFVCTHPDHLCRNWIEQKILKGDKDIDAFCKHWPDRKEPNFYDNEND